MGFRPAITQMLSKLAPKHTRQTLLFRSKTGFFFLFCSHTRQMLVFRSNKFVSMYSLIFLFYLCIYSKIFQARTLLFRSNKVVSYICLFICFRPGRCYSQFSEIKPTDVRSKNLLFSPIFFKKQTQRHHAQGCAGHC